MNSIKFSIAEQAFYDNNYQSPPTDAIGISEEDHWRLISGMNDGERRVYLDGDGRLCLSDKRPSSFHKFDSDKNTWYISDEDFSAISIAEAESKKASLLSEAAKEIEWRKYAVEKGVATDEESEELDAWEMYRVRIMRIKTDAAPDIEWPSPPTS